MRSHCTICRNTRLLLAAGFTGWAGWTAGLMLSQALSVPVWLWGALALGAAVTLWTGRMARVAAQRRRAGSGASGVVPDTRPRLASAADRRGG